MQNLMQRVNFLCAVTIASAGVSMRKIISLICLLSTVLAIAAEPGVPATDTQSSSDARSNIRSDAPDRHIVVKGDTLWDISGKFFKDPWKWPQIWGFNKDTIKDPHWIYPGDVILLDRNTGTLRIGQVDGSGKVTVLNEAGATAAAGAVVALAPKVRIFPSSHDAIPMVPANVIGPFLSRPLVIEDGSLKNAPTLIGAHEERVIYGNGDTVFAVNLPSDKGEQWQIYRPGQTFIDPDTNETLGKEAIYLGKAEATHFADVSTLKITYAGQDINQGDYLAAPSTDAVNAYLPRAPEAKISGQVISIYGGVSQGGQNSIVTLNKGQRDGLENGHVLALYHKGENVETMGKTYALPDERYGLVLVFRTFEKVSYALVMQTRLPVQLLDRANTP
jgi:hypothetical protein